MLSLRKLETEDIPVVAEWLAHKENRQWLDFGGAQQALSPASLSLMNQRDLHHLQVFVDDESAKLAGLVALSNISKPFQYATLWYVLGDKTFSGRGYTTRAVADILNIGFGELGLHSINAWAVETNVGSIRVLEKNGFRRVGVQRQCHFIDGEACDRVLFDKLAEEHS